MGNITDEHHKKNEETMATKKIEQERAYRLKWYYANKAKALESRKKYYRTHKAETIAQVMQYQKKYRQLPRVKAKRKVYQAEYTQRPTTKSRLKTYYSTPRVMQQRRNNSRKYYHLNTGSKKFYDK